MHGYKNSAPNGQDSLTGKVIAHDDIKILILSMDDKTDIYFVEVMNSEGMSEYVEISKDIFNLYMDDIRFLRKMYKQRKDKIHDEMDVDLINIRLNLEDTVVNKEMLIAARQVLETCTDKQKDRFLLHVACGYTYQEIADNYGCTISSVVESINIALEKIRNLNVNDL